MTLPAKFENRMKRILGNEEEYQKFIAAFESNPTRGLWVNGLKPCDNEPSSLIPKGNLRSISFSSNAFYFEMDGIGNSPLHHAGAVYVQEPSAMAPVSCCKIEPGMKILDLCAAPGGKSLQAATRLCGKGVIVSNEIVPSRAKILMQNIERLGVRNSVVTNTDSKALADAFPQYFDLVIVDAPCSGEGMMRKNPLAVSEWSIENIKMCAERQKEILSNAAKTVKPGGSLLYSTCTFATEENEEQVADFLSIHTDFSLSRVPNEIKAVTAPGISVSGLDLSECRRFYPHISSGEGQFLALLVRSESTDDVESNKSEQESLKKSKKFKNKDSKQKNSSKTTTDDENVVINFLRDTLKEGYADEILSPDSDNDGKKYTLSCFEDGYYLVPQIALPESGVFSPGVKIGSVQKGRVLPHHRFFMAFGKDFRSKINFTAENEEVVKYLKGETFSTQAKNGFAVITVCGCTLGGVKVSDGVAKNFYPKGLRI